MIALTIVIYWDKDTHLSAQTLLVGLVSSLRFVQLQPLGSVKQEVSWRTSSTLLSKSMLSCHKQYSQL